MVFRRPFVERFALCYRTIVHLSCPVCDIGVLWPSGWMDQDATWYGSRRQPRPHCVTWGRSSPERGTSQPSSPKRYTAPNFWPVSIVTKRLDWSRCRLLWRWASAQATLC